MPFVSCSKFNTSQALQDQAIADLAQELLTKQNALKDCSGNPLAGNVPNCAQMTTAIQNAIDALPADKFLQGLQSYNSATNTMTLLMSDGSTVDIDMTDLLADAVAGVSTAPTGAAGGDLEGTYPNPTVVPASTARAGKVELATTAEATAGTSTTLAVTPAGLKAAIDAVSTAPTGAAGGDLEGTYPNPTVKDQAIVDAVTGSTAVQTAVAGVFNRCDGTDMPAGASLIECSAKGKDIPYLVNGVIPASQLPSFVDDVLEFPALASFPATGEAGKIYIDASTGKTYRWNGAGYTEISASAGIAVQDEGSVLTTAATSLNFVGAGVQATSSGGAVTVTVPSATTTQSGTTELATEAEATAGTSTTLAVTPAGLKAAIDADAQTSFSSQLSENGFQKLPNGLIIQWGTVDYATYPGERRVDVVFPIVFSHSCLNVQLTRKMSEHSEYGDGDAHLISATNNGFSTSLQSFGATYATDLRGFTWLAIGY